MKWRNSAVVLIVGIMILFLCYSAKSQWVPANGAFALHANFFVEYDAKLYLGTDGNGIFEWDNETQRWSQYSGGVDIRFAKCSAEYEGNLYVGSTSGLYIRTADEKWIKVTYGLSNRSVLSMCVYSEKLIALSDNHLYAIKGENISEMDNEGLPADAAVRSLYSICGSCYAHTETGTMYKYQNGRWVYQDSFPCGVTSVAEYTQSEIVIGTVEGQLIKMNTATGARTMLYESERGVITHIYCDEDSIYSVVNGNGVVVGSILGGEPVWEDIRKCIPYIESENDKKMLFATTNYDDYINNITCIGRYIGKMVVGSDGDGVWVRHARREYESMNRGLMHANGVNARVLCENGDTLFAIADCRYDVAYSLDNGNTWALCTGGVYDDNIVDIELCNNQIYALTITGSVYKLQNCEWRQVYSRVATWETKGERLVCTGSDLVKITADSICSVLSNERINITAERDIIMYLGDNGISINRKYYYLVNDKPYVFDMATGDCWSLLEYSPLPIEQINPDGETVAVVIKGKSYKQYRHSELWIETALLDNECDTVSVGVNAFWGSLADYIIPQNIDKVIVGHNWSKYSAGLPENIRITGSAIHDGYMFVSIIGMYGDHPYNNAYRNLGIWKRKLTELYSEGWKQYVK